MSIVSGVMFLSRRPLLSLFPSGYDAGNGGGGFMGETQSGSATPGKGDKKRRRADNVVPVRVADILDAPGESLVVEGQEVSIVVLVGQVKAVELAATKSVYRLEDRSDRVIDCVHWIEVSRRKGRDEA